MCVVSKGHFKILGPWAGEAETFITGLSDRTVTMVLDEAGECAKRLVGAQELVLRRTWLRRHHDKEVSTTSGILPDGQCVATGRVF